MGFGRRYHPGVFRRDDLRREIPFSDVNDPPDPLFVKNPQVDRMKQGVGGSKSGRVKGSVPEKWYNGARMGPELGRV